MRKPNEKTFLELQPKKKQIDALSGREKRNKRKFVFVFLYWYSGLSLCFLYCSCPLILCIYWLFQSQCRKYLDRNHYSRIKKAAVTTQCAWRGKVARRELRKLKMVFLSIIFFFLLMFYLLHLDLRFQPYLLKACLSWFTLRNSLRLQLAEFLAKLSYSSSWLRFRTPHAIHTFFRLLRKLVHCKLRKISWKSKLKNWPGVYSWRNEWGYVSPLLFSYWSLDLYLLVMFQFFLPNIY